MRFLALVLTVLGATSCSGSKLPPGCTSADSQQFATYQACFDEQTMTKMFTPARAIEICCIDHPIGSAGCNMVCGDTTQTCETYVDANLSATSATAPDITEGCTNYVPDRGG